MPAAIKASNIFGLFIAILTVNNEHERSLSRVMPLYNTERERSQRLQVVRNN